MKSRIAIAGFAMMASLSAQAWIAPAGAGIPGYHDYPLSPGKKPTGAAAAKRISKKRRNRK
jgi:hypothetical protein